MHKHGLPYSDHNIMLQLLLSSLSCNVAAQLDGQMLHVVFAV